MIRPKASKNASACGVPVSEFEVEVAKYGTGFWKVKAISVDRGSRIVAIADSKIRR